ncbi:protein FAM234B [Cyclopterus lumpus]|uniref:Family with sequence similarity 234 member B n=1 Tax=Cyclopterus lumpus TaxID=8103 RepID=A0A8C3APL9_CYCLU|nr:protein FAM234B [Cyclopterus lumpus]XP_034395440.1 protein FAM234B [Cyclopterus lumpus]
MAAALSRALKLPGKKGSELGEYDPLTQADSEDESEEDDLVLNYPRNGLGRDGCLSSGSSKSRGGRSGRLVGADDEAQEDEEEEEDEDEWRERLPNKSRQDRDDAKGTQYWSHRDSGRDRGGEDRGGPGGLGGSGLGVHGADAEKKRLRMKNAVRSAFFLVPLVCAALLVLLCAFLIPCQKGELGKRPQWERALGDAGGVSPPALALWDVDGDSVEDVFLGVTEWTNDTHPRNKIYSAVALSAVSGQVLWRKVMRESVMYIQCGLQDITQTPPVVLLIGKSILVAVNGTTGMTLWSVPLKNIESQAVLLPDLQGDSFPDLLIATLPADELLDLSLTLFSGRTGAKLGHPVPFNLTGQGKLIGPLLHETQQGAYYILFGLGNVEAISLHDIYIRAIGTMPITQALRRKDPGWEGLKKTNSTSFIHIYRGSERVQFLLPLVAGLDNNHNSLDTVSNLNSTKSDWVLVYGSSKLSVLRQRDLRKDWTFNTGLIRNQPVPGHFNDDGILDLFVQNSAYGVMKAMVVDGANGHLLWSAEFVCPHLVLETSAISTSTGQSAFLFWASDPIKAQKNVTEATVSPGVAAAEPLIRKLFLLHPAHPTVLLELTSTTDTAVTSAVSYQACQKDASYITVSSRPTSDSEPGARIVKSISLRAAIAKGRIVRLEEGNKPGGPVKPGVFEVNKFFRGLSFKNQ